MTATGTGFARGALWRLVCERAQAALDCGALQPIETEQELIEAAGVRFQVRCVSSLRRKDAQRAPPSGVEPDNPFLVPAPELLVAEVSATHRALLNKFNVIDHHLLIVTRAFEHQERLLSEADFHALWRCLGEYDSLGFYNGGLIAGASQPHKHLQLVPLPLAPQGPSVPIAPLLRTAPGGGAIATLANLPFAHAYSGLDPALADDPARAARVSHERYERMLAAVGIGTIGQGAARRQAAPYNLLVTRAWMLLVPRCQECFDSISINALGFAGSFFVRAREGIATIRRHGPLAVLAAVAGPCPTGSRRAP